MHIADFFKPGWNFTHQRQPIYRFRGTDLKSRTYLRHQERSVGLPFSLLQGESPGRTAAQRHAHVIPDAHVCAPARQPQVHRALPELSPRQEAPPPPPLDNPHHPGSAPAVETSRRTDTPAHSRCAVMWLVVNVPGRTQSSGITQQVNTSKDGTLLEHVFNTMKQKDFYCYFCVKFQMITKMSLISALIRIHLNYVKITSKR